MRMETLQSLVALLPHFGDRRAVGLRKLYATRWWDYSQLYKAANQFAAFLMDREISAGSRIVLWAANSPEWVCVFLGACLRGLVVVPIDENMSPGFVRKIVSETEATLVIHGVEQDVSGFEEIACSIFQIAEAPANSHLRAGLVTPIRPDDTALILYTSGTTSKPKGVIITHRNLAYQIGAFARWKWLARLYPWRLLVLSPLSHIQGILLGILIPLSMGLSVIYTDALDPSQVIRIIRQNRVTLLMAVPRIQHLIVQALENSPYGKSGKTLAERVEGVHFFPLRRHILFLATHAILGYWFYITMVGGANLSPADEIFWFDCGYVLVQGYGLTETSGLVSMNIGNPFLRQLGSIGKPLAGQTVTLAQDGEVLVRGPHVTPGYYRDAAITREILADGFLHTGDLARQNHLNNLYFLDRKKEVIVTDEGLNVFPRDLEETLNRLPGVRDSVVFGVTENDLTEVHAAVLLGAGHTLEQVIRLASEILEPHQKIRGWSTWPETDFPRTGLMKVKRDEVISALTTRRSEYQTSPEPAPVPPSFDEIMSTRERQARLGMLANYLSSARADDELSKDAPLVDQLGLSSLDTIELITKLERGGAAPLNQFSITQNTTLAELRSALTADTTQERRQFLPVKQPAWSQNLPGRLVRKITQPLLIGLWATFSAKVDVRWMNRPISMEPPFILAGAPHRNWLDGFLLYFAIPRKVRSGSFTVTNRDFSEFFDPKTTSPWGERLSIGLAYYLLWPLVFNFVIVPNFGSTRRGMFEFGQFLDGDAIAITFPKELIDPENPGRHAPGVATMAIQSQTTILPAWIDGNESLTVKPRRHPPQVRVFLGEPLKPKPAMAVGELVQSLEAAFQTLENFAQSQP
jgi:long-chain acyl-CoA synthetase